ncbi:MAG: amidase family protein [Paracoccaceae bacterium]
MTRTDAPFSGPELCKLSARKAVALLRDGQLSPAELQDAAFARIETVEPVVNAVVTPCPERAAKAADNLTPQPDQPGYLAGLPLTIKDLTPVAGVRTTWGSVGYRDHVPETSDPLVERLESRGGIVIGKTNTPEMGAGANTFNDVFGRTRNPWNTSRNAGGSSGGAAVALATGECWLAHGSDLAGSLRTPAAFCGVVGMRPSPGVAGGGPAPAGFLNEGIPGPMARDVGDVALFLDAMAGYDPRHPISIAAPAQSFQNAVDQADAKVHIAFSADQGGFAPVEPEIKQVMADAMALVTRAGGEVSDACPALPGLYDTYVTLRGIHYATVPARQPAAIQQHFKQTLKDNIASGLALDAQAIFSAQNGRSDLYHIMRRFLQGYDVLAIPVVGQAPGPVEEEFPLQVAGVKTTDYIDWLRFSFLATTCALPALSLPIGFTKDGMPVGIQLIGPPRGDAKLLQVARAVEDAVGLATTPIDPIRKH